MQEIFLIIHVVIAIALIGIVLIQRSEQDGFGLGSGSGSNLMTGRQSANLLTRMTAILATLFMLNSVWLSWLAADSTEMSLADRIEKANRLAPAAAPKDDTAEEGQEESEPIPDAPIPADESSSVAPSASEGTAPDSPPTAPMVE